MSELTAALARREERIVVAGKTWTLANPRMRAFLRLEQELHHWKTALLFRAARAAEMSDQQQAVFWREAFAAANAASGQIGKETSAGLPELLQGVATTWLCLQEHHAKEIQTLEDAVDFIDAAIAEGSIEMVRGAVSAISGAEGAKKNGGPTASLGTTSSASAPPDSAGLPK